MIDATDRQIDRLVYELYGLTEDEVAVVEGRSDAGADTLCPGDPVRECRRIPSGIRM
jgi:hypothetical protein